MRPPEGTFDQTEQTGRHWKETDTVRPPKDRNEHIGSDHTQLLRPSILLFPAKKDQKPEAMGVGSNGQDCDARWETLTELWSNTDEHVRRLIAHAQGGQPEGYQMDGKALKKLKTEMDSLSEQEHHCKSKICEEEDAKMLEKS